MPDEFKYDVFLSHSSKDKAVVRPIAERPKNDELLDFSFGFRVSEFGFPPLAACLSANAFGSDWTQLESHTFRFRDPLNQDRHFIPVRLDDAPIKGSLAQFLYINCLRDGGTREGDGRSVSQYSANLRQSSYMEPRL